MIKTLVVAAALTVGLAGYAVAQQAPPAPPAPTRPSRELQRRDHPRCEWLTERAHTGTVGPSETSDARRAAFGLFVLSGE